MPIVLAAAAAAACTEDVAASVSSFLEKAAVLQQASHDADAETDEEEEEQQQQAAASAGSSQAATHSRQQLSQPFLPLDMLKELQASLSHGKQAGVISQLDAEQLRQLLLLLLGHVRLGDSKLLDEQETVRAAGKRAAPLGSTRSSSVAQLG